MSIKLQIWGKLLVLLLGLLLVFNLTKNIFHLWRGNDRLRQTREKLAALKAENLKLKQEQQFLESDFFIEMQIRDKLNLVKPGEVIVILPENLSVNRQTESKTSASEEQILPVWRQWLALFW